MNSHKEWSKAYKKWAKKRGIKPEGKHQWKGIIYGKIQRHDYNPDNLSSLDMVSIINNIMDNHSTGNKKG